MCGKRSCGAMAGIPKSIPLKDTRTGAKKTVTTDAQLMGNKATLNDQRGMNQSKLNVKNPLYGKS